MDETYNQAQVHIAVLQRKLILEAGAIRATKHTLARFTSRLREEAVMVYVSASGGQQLSRLLNSSVQQASMQQAYIDAASGNLDAAIAAVQIAEHQLLGHETALRRDKLGAEAARAQIARTRSEAQSETRTLTITLAQVKGRLVRAVAARQRAQQAAAAAAAAKAAAEQAADNRAAAAQAAARVAAQRALPPPTTPTPASPPATPPAPVSHGAGSGAAAVRAAESQLGVPYVWGGATPGVGFDCSGLTMWAWAQAGVQLAHGATAQYYEIPHVSMNSLQPGDLIFFGTASFLDHEVMYVGSGPYGTQTIIQAAHTGTNVMFSALWPGAYGAGRP